MTRYLAMFRHWASMATGSSYWHVHQRLGSQFAVEKLEGYFNDLTAKARWEGEVDSDGAPLNMIRGSKCYFPTTVLQNALGHWDEWLRSSCTNAEHRRGFAIGARWALENQCDNGGWKMPDIQYDLLTPFSAMSQGEGASVCVRMYHITRQEEYLHAARRAVDFMLLPVEQGGTSRLTPEGIVLEEYVQRTPNVVLNGWIFGLFGLYDVQLVDPTQSRADALASTITALIAMLQRFDAGYWSYYDLTGRLASPFYHRLHIAQLRALEMAFPVGAPVFARTASLYERYLLDKIDKTRAIAMKAIQKVLSPPHIILR